MTSNSSVNYKYSYFKHPVLTKIRGESTYETLHYLKNELKANASSVPTTLGGVNHGYIGMILTPAEYHRITPTDPSTRPPNPGVLFPNQSGTVTQIASVEDTHRTTKKTLSWVTSAWTNHHPENHQSCRHQMTRRPLKYRHWKNHAICTNHPWFPVR